MTSRDSATVLSSVSVSFVRMIGRFGPASVNVAIFVPSISSVLRAYLPDAVLNIFNDAISEDCCISHIQYVLLYTIFSCCYAKRNGLMKMPTASMPKSKKTPEQSLIRNFWVRHNCNGPSTHAESAWKETWEKWEWAWESNCWSMRAGGV